MTLNEDQNIFLVTSVIQSLFQNLSENILETDTDYV